MFNRACFLSNSKLFPNFAEFGESEILFQVLLAVDYYHSSQKKEWGGKYSTQNKDRHVPSFTKNLNYNLKRFPLVIGKHIQKYLPSDEPRA